MVVVVVVVVSAAVVVVAAAALVVLVAERAWRVSKQALLVFCSALPPPRPSRSCRRWECPLPVPPVPSK